MTSNVWLWEIACPFSSTSCSCPPVPVTVPAAFTSVTRVCASSCSSKFLRVSTAGISLITSSGMVTWIVPFPRISSVPAAEVSILLLAMVSPGITEPKISVPPLNPRPPICWTPEPTVVIFPVSDISIAWVNPLVFSPSRAKLLVPSFRVPANWSPTLWLNSKADVSASRRADSVPLPVNSGSKVKLPATAGIMASSLPDSISTEPGPFPPSVSTRASFRVTSELFFSPTCSKFCSFTTESSVWMALSKIRESESPCPPSSRFQVAPSPLMVKVFFPVPAVTWSTWVLPLSVTLLLPFPAVTSPVSVLPSSNKNVLLPSFALTVPVILPLLVNVLSPPFRATTPWISAPLSFSTVVFTASSNAIAVPVVDAALIWPLLVKDCAFEASTTAWLREAEMRLPLWTTSLAALLTTRAEPPSACITLTLAPLFTTAPSLVLAKIPVPSVPFRLMTNPAESDISRLLSVSLPSAFWNASAIPLPSTLIVPLLVLAREAEVRTPMPSATLISVVLVNWMPSISARFSIPWPTAPAALTLIFAPSITSPTAPVSSRMPCAFFWPSIVPKPLPARFSDAPAPSLMAASPSTATISPPVLVIWDCAPSTNNATPLTAIRLPVFSKRPLSTQTPILSVPVVKSMLPLLINSPWLRVIKPLALFSGEEISASLVITEPVFVCVILPSRAYSFPSTSATTAPSPTRLTDAPCFSVAVAPPVTYNPWAWAPRIWKSLPASARTLLPFPVAQIPRLPVPEVFISREPACFAPSSIRKSTERSPLASSRVPGAIFVLMVAPSPIIRKAIWSVIPEPSAAKFGTAEPSRLTVPLLLASTPIAPCPCKDIVPAVILTVVVVPDAFIPVVRLALSPPLRTRFPELLIVVTSCVALAISPTPPSWTVIFPLLVPTAPSSTRTPTVFFPVKMILPVLFRVAPLRAIYPVTLSWVELNWAPAVNSVVLSFGLMSLPEIS